MNFSDHPALFFDGVCNLCNSSVDWLIRHDKRRVLRYGSLQGQTAHRFAPDYAEEAGLSTVVLIDQHGLHIRSSAIGRALKALGGWWNFVGSLLLVVPRPIRDRFYRSVADSRYRRWGKRDTCRLPTADERELFLP